MQAERVQRRAQPMPGEIGDRQGETAPTGGPEAPEIAANRLAGPVQRGHADAQVRAQYLQLVRCRQQADLHLPGGFQVLGGLVACVVEPADQVRPLHRGADPQDHVMRGQRLVDDIRRHRPARVG